MPINFLTITVKEDKTTDEFLKEFLHAFDKRTSNKTNLIQYEWGQIWHALLNVSLNNRGGDVAEIGSTWVQSLAAMNSLRIFSNEEIKDIGGMENFIPSLWQNMMVANNNKVWGIPMRADVRTIYYWEDMLESAGVEDAENAFSTFDKMNATLEKLQKHYPTPWTTQTANLGNNAVLNITSWIRSAGGDLITSDGKETMFASPESLAGIHAYFELYRFMPKQGHPYDDEPIQQFCKRETAAIISGPWMLSRVRDTNPEAMVRKVKAAFLPGPSFIGGTSLIVWKHAYEVSGIINLIKSLYSTPFYAKYCSMTGVLPVTVNFSDEEYLLRNPNLPVLQQAILGGKSINHHTLWGVIEERLSKSFGAIWAEIYSAETPPSAAETAAIVDKHIIPLARRINIMLSE